MREAQFATEKLHVVYAESVLQNNQLQSIIEMMMLGESTNIGDEKNGLIAFKAFAKIF